MTQEAFSAYNGSSLCTHTMGWLGAVGAHWLLSLCMGFKACTWLEEWRPAAWTGPGSTLLDCCRGAQFQCVEPLSTGWMWGTGLLLPTQLTVFPQGPVTW